MFKLAVMSKLLAALALYYPTELLDIPVKPFFPCIIMINYCKINIKQESNLLYFENCHAGVFAR